MRSIASGVVTRNQLAGLLAVAAGTLVSVGAARADDWTLYAGGPVVVGEPVESFALTQGDYLGAFDPGCEVDSWSFVSFAPAVCRPVIVEPAYCAPVISYPAYAYPVYSYPVYTPYYASYPIASPYWGAYSYPVYSYGGWYGSGCGDSWLSYGGGWSLSFSFSGGHWRGHGSSGWGWGGWNDDCRWDRGWWGHDWRDDHRHDDHHDSHGHGDGGHGGGGGGGGGHHSNRSVRDTGTGESLGVPLGGASSSAQAGFGPAPEDASPAARMIDSRRGGRASGRPSAKPVSAIASDAGVPVPPVAAANANSTVEFGPAPAINGKPSAMVRGERRPTPKHDQRGALAAGGVNPGVPITSGSALPSVKPAAPMVSGGPAGAEAMKLGSAGPSLPRSAQPAIGGAQPAMGGVSGLGGVNPVGPRVDPAASGVMPGGRSRPTSLGGVTPGMSRPESSAIGGVTPSFSKPEDMKIGGVTPRLIQPTTTFSPSATPAAVTGTTPAFSPSSRRPTPRVQTAPISVGSPVATRSFERGWSGNNSKQVGTFQPAMPAGVYDVPATRNMPASSGGNGAAAMPRVRTGPVGQSGPGPSVTPVSGPAPSDRASGSGKRPTPKRK